MPVSIATQQNWPSIVQKDLSLVYTNQQRNFQSQLGSVARIKGATQGTEYDLETGDIGEMEEFDGEIAFDSPTEGYKKSVTETQWAKGLKATRQLLRNDLYQVLIDRTEALADAANDKWESVGVSPFIDGFSSAFTTGDALSLWNTAHTNRQNSTTQGNRGTSALSAAAVEATRLLMKKFKTNRDNKRVSAPDMLIVPDDLEEKAYEIIKSAGKVDTAMNNRNFHQGKYKLLVWSQYLTDTNDWFMVDSREMLRKLIFRVWEDQQFFRSGEFNTLVSKYACYFSIAISTVEWRWGYGHQVS